MININISPIVFMNIRWYGVAVATAILVLILWLLWQVRRGANISPDTIFSAALVGIPSGIVVSRLMHVLDLWDYYSQNPQYIIGGEGLSVWGAVLGATLGIWIYSRFAKFSFGYFTDLIAPGIILAQIVGRFGCTINGCCYGVETTLPWAIIYHNPDSLGPIGIPVQPTTLYEIVYLAIIFFVVKGLRGKLRPEGSQFLVYLSLYSIWRIGIDFIRDGRPFIFGLHEAQFISLVVLAITIPLLVLRTHRVKAEQPEEAEVAS